MDKLWLNGLGGKLMVDKEKIVITRKGFTSFMLHGIKGDKTIPVSSISAIQFKKPSELINGYIQFTVPGGNECKGGILSATQDENTVIFTVSHLDEALTIKKFLEEIIVCKNNGPTLPIKSETRQNDDSYANDAIKQGHFQSFSSADEILKFKVLMDQGVITQEEFNKKKKELLGI